MEPREEVQEEVFIPFGARVLEKEGGGEEEGRPAGGAKVALGKSGTRQNFFVDEKTQFNFDFSQPDLTKHETVTEAPEKEKRWIDTGFIHNTHGTFTSQVLTEFK